MTMSLEDASAWEDEEPNAPAEHPPVASLNRELSPLSLRLGRPPKTNYRDEDYDPSHTESENDDHNDPGVASPLKRHAEGSAAYRPLKRQKGLLNGDYLNLLNEEIESASQRMSTDDAVDFFASQLGLTCWSSHEKAVFFESVARLGKDDLEGIAARIGTKSTVEVNHYRHILEEACEERLNAGFRPALARAEVPAAVELSQQCCFALDEAADAVSLRQERREQQREEAKWGRVWDLTPEVAANLGRDIDRTRNNRELPSAELFHLPKWLELSRDVFMNSSVPGNNWTHVDEMPPSIWATTLEDFRSLAISITRRLVQTAIFAAATRVRTQRQHRPFVREIVRRKDVRSALESLGMTANASEFWRQSARRLRLDVVNDDDEDCDPEPMNFEEVEEALGVGETTEPEPEVQVDQWLALVHSSSSEASDDEEYRDISDDEERAVNLEVAEVFEHSLADFPETLRMRKALGSRIAAERQQEQFAEQYDQHASYKEELEMWDLLQRSPPAELPKKPDPGPVPKSNHDIEGMYPLGKDWRKNTTFYSEWETRPR